jgi:ribosomal protein L5
MPPHVIGELLRAAIDLPSTEDIEGLVIHQQDAAGSLSFGVAERADVDPVRSAMDGVRTGVS